MTDYERITFGKKWGCCDGVQAENRGAPLKVLVIQVQTERQDKVTIPQVYPLFLYRCALSLFFYLT